MPIINFIVIFLFFLGFITAAAQPSGVVYLNPANKKQDTLDFDITLFGKPLRAEFYVDNTGNSTIYIPQKLVPFFSIERITNDPNDFRHLEFTNETILPFSVTAAKPNGIFQLIFTSNLDTTKLDYALGFKIGRMVVGLADKINASAPFQSTDTFTLIAWKTKNFLASKRENLRFDSVYLGSVNVQAQWMLKNVSDGEINVFGSYITPLSPIVGLGSFSVAAPLDAVIMPRDSHAPWTIRYSPMLRGSDSARLALSYFPNINGRADSTAITLHGVGVQQEIALSNRSFGLPNPIILRGDTIDLGDINVGETATATIIIENRGNLSFGGTAGQLSGQPDNFFSLERYFNDKQNLQPGKFDTATVQFKPLRRGTFTANFSISSDIRSRISTAPDSASKLVWHIRGRAAEPELIFSNDTRDTVNFGQAIMPADPSCSGTFVRRLAARNIGNALLTLTFDSIQAPFFIRGGAKRDVLPNDSANIEIEFSPQIASNFASSLTITSNEAPTKKNRKFFLIGSSATQTAQIAAPNIVSAAGRKISVPITVHSSVKYATNFSATLVYDTTLLDFTGFDRMRTSSESALTTILDPKAGSIAFSLYDASGTLFAKDTLIRAEFNTYFGAPIATALSLVRAKAGNENCDSAAHLVIQAGSYSPDSSCGNAYRAILGMKGMFRFVQIGENPTTDILQFAFETALPLETSVILYSSSGQQIAVIAKGVFSEGIHYAETTTQECASGLYFVEMRAGLYRKVFPVLIAR